MHGPQTVEFDLKRVDKLNLCITSYIYNKQPSEVFEVQEIYCCSERRQEAQEGIKLGYEVLLRQHYSKQTTNNNLN